MIVERLPMVAPPPEPWEAEYQQWSDERRRKFLKKLPEGLVNPKAEFEERDQGEDFEPAPRETEADKTGDQRTMHRRLDEFLFLVVQDAKTGQWGFPRREHVEGKTMREVARQAMEEAVGDSIETYLVGNAPLGHFYEAKTGADGKEGGEGTNFYHRAQWLDGTLKLESRYKDYKWLTKVCARVSRRLFSRTSFSHDGAVDGNGDDETQLSITGLLSTEAYLTALSDTYSSLWPDPFPSTARLSPGRLLYRNRYRFRARLTHTLVHVAGGAWCALQRGAPRIHQGDLLTSDSSARTRTRSR
jgi:large subunit ribosomal protein L46